ncbi:ShlB/FhaC/HecB family hemolysin secretion/activation protein [Coleofasciculus sp.]|uniref:ShlB/FhaC/HecB family hemolysin secretion/activation protein n=1 Tax=Coleofasciculus sp. TaxID=3100458 RepID=UPI0039F98AC2
MRSKQDKWVFQMRYSSIAIILALSPVASPVSANMGEVADTTLQPEISLTANQVGDALVRVQHQNLSDSLSGWHKTFKPTKGVEFRSQGSPTPGINPVEPQPPALPEPELLPSPDELLQPPASPPTIAPPLLPDNIPGTITVERFEVIGSTVFSPEELAAVTAPFSQRPIAFAQLMQVQDAIAELYIQRGYITSGAFIPPQALNNGVVTIEVIEGEVERIEVTGTRRLNSNYVRSRLARATPTPLQVNQLVETLQLLQLNPLVENVSAELAAGSKTGTSVLRVAVEEAPSFSAILRVDNGRSPSVGTVRRHVTLEQGNLFGFGDSLILGYTNTDGSNSLDEASYTIPINARNSTFKLSYRRSSSHVIEAPFNQVDIESNARDYQITYRQPLIDTPTQEFALGLSAVRRESDTSLLGEGFRLSPGANEQGETRISAIEFFQEWINRGSTEVFALRSQFSLGIGALNATINEKSPDSQFFSWRGQAQYLRLLAPDTILLFRSDIQLSNDALVPIEQFGLGGIDSVRGYRQDALLSDNGLFTSAEVRIPIARIPEWNSILQVTPFVEIGTTWNSSGRANPNPNTLAAAGLGLLWRTGDKLTARFDWGIPLIDLPGSKDTWQENGLSFRLEYKVF